jgi:hypothetical protein
MFVESKLILNFDIYLKGKVMRTVKTNIGLERKDFDDRG